jgi:glycosyltransferase involved in cell wall biosynthesis
MNQLAIVIPAYKPDYLAEALESLAAQSDQRFAVYIGDDASPHPLEALIDGFRPRLDLHYVRFEQNLGGKDLVAQWTRCVALSKETWIWLFSDDDLAAPNCVEAFYAFLNSAAQDDKLIHFQTDIIDGESNLIRHTRAYPTRLPAYDFAMGRLQFHWSSFAVEYIFMRQAWTQCGGFVAFPAGWCADDASWIQLAAGKGILTLPAGRVQWRQSGRNITAGQSPYVAQKTDAMLMYMDWLIGHFHQESLQNKMALKEAFHHWFFKLFGTMNPRLGMKGMLSLAKALRKSLSSSTLLVFTSLLKNEYFAARTSLKDLLFRIGGKSA